MSRTLFQYHPVLGYHFIPGLKARVDHEGGGYLVRVNQQGFRCNHDFIAEKSPDKFRVLLFGDSFTAGDGVSNKHRYGDVLEGLLPNVEVYNFGLSGTGTDQQYLAYREFGASLEHDLVVMAVQLENIKRVNARFRATADADGAFSVLAKPYFDFSDDGTLALHHVPVPKDPLPIDGVPDEIRDHVDWGGHQGNHAWLRKAINKLGPRVKDFAVRFTHHQPLPVYDRPDDPQWKLMKAVFLKWIGELRRPAIIFVVPLYHYIEDAASPGGYQARIGELSELPAVTIVDSLPEFRKHPMAERRNFRFQRDAHPSPAGHQVLAESLAGAIRPMLERKKAAS